MPQKPEDPVYEIDREGTAAMPLEASELGKRCRMYSELIHVGGDPHVVLLMSPPGEEQGGIAISSDVPPMVLVGMLKLAIAEVESQLEEAADAG